MVIRTPRLTLCDLIAGMAEDIHRNSLDEDTRRFVPDEVFETLEHARETLSFLMEAAHGAEGPFVYAVMLEGQGNIGYVQLCRTDDGWEVGYHIAKAHTGKGYAAEALQAFLPFAMEKLNEHRLLGIVLEENAASIRVLEKCGFRLVFQGEAPYQGAMRPIRRYVFDR